MVTLTVRGLGIAQAVPDRVELGLVLTTLAPTADAAYADVAARAARLDVLLEELGVPVTDRMTTGLSLHEEPGYEGRTVSGSYRAWSRIDVRLADPAAAAPVIAKAVEAGAGVENLRWSVDRDHPAALEACRRAADAARERAQAYSEALGLNLGRVVSAVDADAAPDVALAGAGARMRGITVHPIDPGQARIPAAIDVTFELEDTTVG